MEAYTEDLQAAIDSLTLFWNAHPLQRSRRSRPLIFEWAKEILKAPSPFFKSDEERSHWETTWRNRTRYQTEHMGERLLNALSVVVELDRLLNVRLLLEAAKWYEIEAIDVKDDLPSHTWAQIQWAVCGNGYHLDFNPHVDRRAASRTLSEKLGLRVRPAEVYYWIFFHELAHTRRVNLKLSAGAVFNLMAETYTNAELLDRLRKQRQRSEGFADRWASHVYKKWQSTQALDFLITPLERKLARERARRCEWIQREDGSFACKRARGSKRTCARCDNSKAQRILRRAS